VIKLIKISFVIPCYGSELTINGVLDEIHEVMSLKPEFDYEIICVNDSSPDGVYSVLRKRVNTDTKLTIIELSRNMGKACALLAGYSIVTGDHVVNVDDDGQCPLDRFWDLFEPMQNGFDVSIAAYPVKKQSLLKNIGSWVNSLMARVLLRKPKGLKTSNFSIYRRYTVDEIKKYKNIYPYTFGFLLRVTSKMTNVKMEQRKRAAGKSTYTLRKSFAGWMNGFTAFSVVPLRISSFIGLLTAVVGFIYGISIIIRSLVYNVNFLSGYPSIMIALLIIGGMLMMMFGMLGEYLGRLYINQNNLPQFVIREIVKGDSSEEVSQSTPE